jgi:hypothetical protein
LNTSILVKENVTYLVELFGVEAAYLKEEVFTHCLRYGRCVTERSDETTGQFIWKKWQVGYHIKHCLKQIMNCCTECINIYEIKLVSRHWQVEILRGLGGKG